MEMLPWEFCAWPLASADRRAAMGQGRGQARVGRRIADLEWLPATRDRGIVGSWGGVDMFFRERRAICALPEFSPPRFTPSFLHFARSRA